MKISIIIPVYNSEKYLRRCLNSVLGQTYANIEIILINDGSTDESLLICQEYAKNDARISVINQENKGPAAARNAGIKRATGTYIGFVDADDFIEPVMYEKMMAVAENTNTDLVVTNFKVYDAGNLNSRIVRNTLPYNKVLSQKEIKEFFIAPYFGGYLGILPSLCNKIYKLDFIKSNNFEIDKTRVRAEDYWFNFYVFQKAFSIIVLDDAFYHYYKNEGSIMHSFRENQFEGFLKTRETLLESNKKLKIDFSYPAFNEEFVDNTNEYILLAILNNKKKIVFKILKNKEFLKAYASIIPITIHGKLIQKLLKYKLYFFAYIMYKLWATKIKH